VVIREGDPADFYYVVCAGRAEVLTQEHPDVPPVQIAQKGPGEGFGEEALLSGAPRNATVRMLTDGVVRRLGAADFDGLLKQSVVVHLTPADAVARVQGANGVWLDVRHPEESARDPVDGAMNLPAQGPAGHHPQPAQGPPLRSHRRRRPAQRSRGLPAARTGPRCLDAGRRDRSPARATGRQPRRLTRPSAHRRMTLRSSTLRLSPYALRR
jgi:hypothetical protein